MFYETGCNILNWTGPTPGLDNILSGEVSDMYEMMGRILLGSYVSMFVISKCSNLTFFLLLTTGHGSCSTSPRQLKLYLWVYTKYRSTAHLENWLLSKSSSLWLSLSSSFSSSCVCEWALSSRDLSQTFHEQSTVNCCVCSVSTCTILGEETDDSNRSFFVFLSWSRLLLFEFLSFLSLLLVQ